MLSEIEHRALYSVRARQTLWHQATSPALQVTSYKLSDLGQVSVSLSKGSASAHYRSRGGFSERGWQTVKFYTNTRGCFGH